MEIITFQFPKILLGHSLKFPSWEGQALPAEALAKAGGGFCSSYCAKGFSTINRSCFTTAAPGEKGEAKRILDALVNEKHSY